jgi:hypothetical protein
VSDPPTQRPIPQEILPGGASISAPPAHAAPGHRSDAAAASFELVVRKQPLGPTVSVRVTGDTRLGAVKLEAMELLECDPALATEFVLALDGRRRLDELRTVGEESLWDLAFIQLGRPADVGLEENR